MPNFSYVNIELPEAGRLADLYGFANDLSSCRNYCEKYMKNFPGEDTECYWTFVFVKYNRCFNGGIRRPFTGEIPIPLSPEEEKLHDSILHVRDKHLERAGVSRSVAMKLTGHKTESVYRRYAIVSVTDLSDGLNKLAALHSLDSKERTIISLGAQK